MSLVLRGLPGLVPVLVLAAFLAPRQGLAAWPAAARVDPVWLASLLLAGLALLLRPVPAWRGTLGGVLLLLQMPVLARLLPGGQVLPAGWQQAPLAAVGFILLAAALLAWRNACAALLAGSLAAAVAGLLLLAQLFGAEALLRAAPGPALSLLETAGFAALALGAIALHPADPLQVLRGEGAGAHARRQLLPAALLVPPAVGLLMQWGLDARTLDQPAALSLGVAANGLLMLAVLAFSGRQIDRMDRRKREKQAAREQRVRRQGQRDGVTRLLNRLGWDADLKAAESRCRKQKLDACVIIIDLDGLKQINDTQGHEAGDDFIRRAAKALKGAARRKDTLARLGGDEFGYLAVGCDADGAQALCQRLGAALKTAGVPASLGHALRGTASLAAAVKAADAAMYDDKKARGRGRR